MVRTVMADWSLFKRRSLFEHPRRRFRKTVTVKAFIQARQGSSRLPNKIYKDINGAPMLYHTINMVKRAQLIDDVIVISPQKLPDIPEGVKEFVYEGDEADVLGRYFYAVKEHPCDYIVRLTSDCPVLDFHLIDYVIASTVGFDYGSNVLVPTFPDGMDVEVFKNKTLTYLHETATTPYDREHVTTLLRNNQDEQLKHNLISVQSFQDHSYLKLSVDTQEDLDRVCALERTE